MSREIPRAVKDRAFRLWLQGESYRKICEETGMSMGALSAHINELRKGAPNLDQLRELNVMLSKGGSSVFDAMRGGRLLDEVGRLGVSLDELEGFVKLPGRISSEKGLEAERFIEASIRLMGLEAKTGKNYEQVLKDFEERTKRVEDLIARAKSVQEENRKLEETKAQLEGEIREAGKKLSSTHQELNSAISTKERLQKLSLEKTATLAEFIEDYESLGFNPKDVQKLAEWKRSLKAIGIDPDDLEGFIKKKGTFEKQLQEVEAELTEGKARLKILSRLEGNLQRRVDDIQRIERILQSRMSSFACPHCGGVTWREIRRFEVSQCLAMRQSIIIPCLRCGAPNTYNPYEVLARLGFEVLS